MANAFGQIQFQNLYLFASPTYEPDWLGRVAREISAVTINIFGASELCRQP
jgi:hypothetical protein